ncbi:hypothetical protein DSUL_90085 [Desulfovibrionales bacterium]
MVVSFGYRLTNPTAIWQMTPKNTDIQHPEERHIQQETDQKMKNKNCTRHIHYINCVQ